MRDLVVGQTGEDRIRCVELGSGQREKKPGLARRAVKKPTPADIGVEPDVDLRHGHPRMFGHHAMARSHREPDPAAHDDAMPPAQQGFGIGVDQVVKTILTREEIHGVGVAANVFALRGSMVHNHGLVHLVQVGAGTESPVPHSFQYHQHHARVGCPGTHASGQQIDHLQAQCIEGALGIQTGHTHARSLAGAAFLEQNGSGKIWGHRNPSRRLR